MTSDGRGRTIVMGNGPGRQTLKRSPGKGVIDHLCPIVQQFDEN